ncbi:hypothetical protein BU23DRAFT_639650 [Bimuria novae-zelandiae CBS 107.79]|uniref:alpha-glucosidase n=1 Tax=Bimuria novae-zelandiae CBS 107.79 TaxID=1447943 RepID=A0A6A5VFD7_9PLEO|nr:hypothetical protein BU23DRAFT_639650 [Bimuria novae-zelandiae CBS 107.79]
MVRWTRMKLEGVKRVLLGAETARGLNGDDGRGLPWLQSVQCCHTGHGFTADLTITRPNCHAFGNDIADLLLEVQYQTKERLNLRIYPKHIAPVNSSWFILPDHVVDQPKWDRQTDPDSSNLCLEWSNDPTFQFRVKRKSTGEELFSTYGHVIVYVNQFLELVTNMVAGYNLYGLAENIYDFRLGNNYTQTFYAVDAGHPVDRNAYGVFPFYQEIRYHHESASTAHGVYGRNDLYLAHGQEWLLREKIVTYHTLGGSSDFYFLSGQKEDGSSSALTTISQFQSGCVGLSAMQMYWTFGFHQLEVIDGYCQVNISLECFWNDLDIYVLYRDWTNNHVTFPVPEFTEWIEALHANEQYYVPIIDSNIYVSNPTNDSDYYPPYENGAGRWTNEMVTWHSKTPFDGIWIDLSEAASFCAGSCGNGRLDENPVHPQFLLPGDLLTFDFNYPEGFNITNATEASSAPSASASQSSALSTSPILPIPTTTTQGRIEPTPSVRNLNFPPYVINNVQAGHALSKSSIAPNATHNDQYNTTEYEMHNLFGLQISNATYHSLLELFPGRRPFTVGRSVSAGSGKTTAHWGGDYTSTWGSMFLSISQALTMMMSGIPMFGPDTCGFTRNTDFQLCSRWMEIGAFFPFYRNHNVKATIGQEAYRCSSVAEASRRAMAVRYNILTYMYTLFYHAHTKGETVMRALAWEFPDNTSLRETFNQFLLGPSILVTPVLQPNVDYVNGVFPGIGQGENVTLSAPLEHINVHPKLTTGATRRTPYSLLVATGDLYLDDGESLVPNATHLVKFTYANNSLSFSSEGSYRASQPLASITIAGLKTEPADISLEYGDRHCNTKHLITGYNDGVLKVANMDQFTPEGAFQEDLKLELKF